MSTVIDTNADAPTFDYSPESITREQLPGTPEKYRQMLVRLMSMQAYAERCGATELGPWIERAPSYVERKVLGRILADEANHAYLLYRELEAMGVSEAESIAIAEGRNGGSGPVSASMAGPKAVSDDQNVWEDIPLNNMFLDRAGRFMVSNFAESSYEPWARVCQIIVKDESLHEGFGLQQLRKMLNEDGIDREVMAQRITRWFALGLNFFGPPKSSKTEMLRAYGLKRRDNEQLRRAYREEVTGLLEELGAADLVRLRNDQFPYE